MKQILILLLSVICITGCISENNDDCPPIGRYIYFENIIPKYDFREVVENVHLYFYDESGYNVTNLICSYNDLIGLEKLAKVPSLKTGSYSVVAVVNMADWYEVEGIDNLQTLNISLSEESISEKQSDIYQSYTTLNIKEGERFINPDTMLLAKNTNHINFTLEFEKGYDLPDDWEVEVMISGNNGAYNYHNDCLDLSLREYYPHGAIYFGDNDYSYVYFLTTMQIALGSDLALSLSIKDEEGNAKYSFSFNIPDALAEVVENGEKKYDTNEKLQHYDEFDFTLKVGESFNTVSLTIDDWYLINSEEEI